jgi:hypothetical protein
VSSSVPVALFAYNRPDHFRKTIEALAKNYLASETLLYIFIDGPRNEYDKKLGLNIRAIAIENKNKFASVEIVVSDSNKGLAESIVSGVTKMLELFDSIIVLEDDLVTSPFFLEYMNEGIRLYRNHPMVASIHGYIYPIKKSLPETFFLRGADCWGWATWRSAWIKYNSNGKYLLRELEKHNLLHGFDFDGAAANSRMLADQIDGKNDSWAIRWHATAFLEGMLTLYPNTSLVFNIGNDDSGTHSIGTNIYNVSLTQSKVTIKKIQVAENKSARNEFIRFFRQSDTVTLQQDFLHNLLMKIKCWLK